jgi:uncharacterized membrane protein
VAPLNPKDQHDTPRRRPWLLGVVIALCVLLVGVLMVAGAMVVPESDFEFTQAQLLEETLGVAHDELIMLIISLIVVIQIAANFKLLRRIPNHLLLLCSFGLVAFSTFCTVAESLVLPEVLNYFEHLSFMIASILLAIWCWRVFGSKKRESA